MKIATITYSWAQNWGAALQAYALVEYLNSQGHSAKLIDYREFDGKLISTVKSVPDGIYDLLTLPESIRRVKKYINFRKDYFKLTEKCNTTDELEKLNGQFDAFITGSDQVWNVGHGVNRDFYLQFVRSDKRRISYAASFGVSDIPNIHRRDTIEGLGNISYISVREKTGKELIKKMTGQDSAVVLDPVFLLSPKHWEAMMGSITEKSPYIFVYPTQISKTLRKCIRRLKKMTGLPIITPFFIEGCKTVKDIGPLEFITYIKKAEYVVATSFHATAFSVIFEKPLYVVTHSQTGSRTTDLLEQLGLEDCILHNENEIGKCCWNYQDKKSIIQKKISESKAFLSQALS